MYQTCLLTSQHERFAGLLFLTPAGVLQNGCTGVDTALRLAQRLASLSLESAGATRCEDKRMIDDCVRRMPGGFRAMDLFVRGCIKDALHVVHASFEGDFGSLVRAGPCRTSRNVWGASVGEVLAAAVASTLFGAARLPPPAAGAAGLATASRPPSPPLGRLRRCGRPDVRGSFHAVKGRARAGAGVRGRRLCRQCLAPLSTAADIEPPAPPPVLLRPPPP